MSYNFTTQRIC